MADTPFPPLTDHTAGMLGRAEELAYELKIADVMTREPRAVEPSLPMSALLEMLRQARISGMPVLAGRRVVGIVSLEDVIRALRDNHLSAPVGQYMTRDVIAVQDTDPVVKALELFTRRGVGRLPVLNAQGELAGLITKGDISRGLLRALQAADRAEEVRRYRASHLFEDIESDRTSLLLRYTVPPQDFARGGHASGCVKRALTRLGAAPEVARRCGIALYEAEMNLIIHTRAGGFIKVEIEPHRIILEVTDDGPGIPDINRALTPGFSTAPEWVRALGFGAGMGLPNIKRCVDELRVTSDLELGTKLYMCIATRPAAAAKSP